MDKLIVEIFKSFQFELMNDNLDNKNISFIVVNQKNTKKEYFLITFFDNLDEVLEIQKEIHTRLRKNNKNLKLSSDWEKNTTMLIFYKTNAIPMETASYRNILEIEENPYFFKKQILSYTDNQVELYRSEQGAVKHKEFLEEYVNNIEKYEKFKKSNKDLSENVYALVANLHIKLPFVSLKIIKKQKQNLINDFENHLTENERAYYDFINQLEFIDEDSYKVMKDLK